MGKAAGVMTATIGNVDFVFPLVELVCKGLAHSGKRRRQNKCLYRRRETYREIQGFVTFINPKSYFL